MSNISKKRKIIAAVLAVILLAAAYCAYNFLYMEVVDSLYAEKYGRVLGSYDIGKLDRFLDSDASITYKGNTKTYKELRDNVIKAFDEKRFVMAESASYGHGDGFSKGIQEVGIESFPEIDDRGSWEVYVEMNLKRGLLGVKVQSLESNNQFFGYLFFGEKLEAR